MNTILSTEQNESLLTERLLNNAWFIAELDRIGPLTEQRLAAIAEANHIFRINIRWVYDHPKMGWTSSDVIPLTVTGGREQGFRGSAYKSNWRVGDWRVEVETEDGRTFALKPMNCPGGVSIFAHGLKSYRDLPIRMAEFGKVHRYEPSGALHGLMRVRHFTQDDAHIFCTLAQMQVETP